MGECGGGGGEDGRRRRKKRTVSVQGPGTEPRLPRRLLPEQQAPDRAGREGGEYSDRQRMPTDREERRGESRGVRVKGGCQTGKPNQIKSNKPSNSRNHTSQRKRKEKERNKNNKQLKKKKKKAETGRKTTDCEDAMRGEASRGEDGKTQTEDGR